MHILTNNCDKVVASYCVAIVIYHMWLDPRFLLNADMEMATKKFVLVWQF